MKIIVGLGNPGEQYKNTKHNAGFMMLDKIIKDLNLTWEKNKKFNAETARNGDTLYVKPQTFMNQSGQSVASILSYFKLIPKKLGILKTKNADLSDILTVIHDDIDIELGKYKKSIDSRSAGHNGVQSIINHLKTKNFSRIRIGIFNEERKMVPRNKVVLENFNKQEQESINKIIAEIEL